LPHSTRRQPSSFLFYHAQKEAQARVAESLAKDLACFFSGDYLSACDLSTGFNQIYQATLSDSSGFRRMWS
jgi:hypothetical protein